MKIYCNSAKRIYLFEIKKVREITLFLGNELATVPIAVVRIALLVRVTLTDANIVKYNRQKKNKAIFFCLLTLFYSINKMMYPISLLSLSYNLFYLAKWNGRE